LRRKAYDEWPCRKGHFKNVSSSHNLLENNSLCSMFLNMSALLHFLSAFMCKRILQHATEVNIVLLFPRSKFNGRLSEGAL
jgi:hypothetical protein